MADNSSVQTDLIAVDKTQAAVKKAQAGLREYAKQAGASIASVADKFTKLGAVFTGAVGYLSGAAATKMLDTAKAAKILGTSVEQMQVITVAAKKGPEELTGALSHLMMQLGQARSGSVQVAQALAGAGLSMKTMASGSAQQALQEIIKGLGGINDPAQRAAKSMAIFGREGYQSMAALLSGGAGALDAAQKKIADLGIGFKSVDVDRIKKAKEAMTDLKASMEAFGQTIAATVAPAIADVAKTLAGIVGRANSLHGELIGGSAKWIAYGVAAGGAATAIGKVAAAVRMLAASSIGALTVKNPYLMIPAALIGGSYYAGKKIGGAIEAGGPGRGGATQAQIDFYNANRSRMESEARANQRASQRTAGWNSDLAGTEALSSKESGQKDKLQAWRESNKIDPEPLKKYNEAVRVLGQGLVRHALTVDEYRKRMRELKDELGVSRGRIEEFTKSVADLEYNQARGLVTAAGYAESMKRLADSFGPLASATLGANLAEKMARINEDAKAGFGRGLTGGAAEKERAARAREALEGVGGFGLTDQEQARRSAERSALARRNGRGDEAEKIEADAERERVRRIRERADRRAGLSGPNADTMTNQEKLRAGLASVGEQIRGGAFANQRQAGGAFGNVLAQFGIQPSQFKANFEGIQDTWKRIQTSKASTSDDPQQQAKELLQANLPALKAAGVDTAALLKELVTIAKENDRKPPKNVVSP